MTLLKSELKTIKLYGPLKQFSQNEKGIVTLAVCTTQEAIKACCTVLPGFEKFLIESKELGLTFAVFNGKRNIARNELGMGCSDEIRIVPVIIGSKQAGVFQTILGAVLVAVGVVLSFTPLAAASPFLYATGASMMIGGVVQMLSPVQGGLASRQDPDNKPSYAFGGPVNTIAQGNPVPILYGRRRIGGAIISAGIYAEDQQ